MKTKKKKMKMLLWKMLNKLIKTVKCIKIFFYYNI